MVTLAEDDGTALDLGVVPVPRISTFANPGHAVAFGRYLFRQGKERPNELTDKNCFHGAVTFPGGRRDVVRASADGRNSDSRDLMNLVIADLKANWSDLRNEVLYMAPTTEGAALDDFTGCDLRFDNLWRHITMLGKDFTVDISDDIFVVHHDQNERTPGMKHPTHFHRVYNPAGTRSFGEAIYQQPLEEFAGREAMDR